MQQIQQELWFLKEGFKSMINYYKRHGLPEFKWEHLPTEIVILLLIILFYRFIYTILKCIKNKKIQTFDVLYIVLNRLNSSLIFHLDDFGRFTWKLVAQAIICCGLFITLHIMYKEKILCKKKNEIKEKPHDN